MVEFEEVRAQKIDRDRYSFQWIPDRWPCDNPTGDQKTVHPDRRTSKEILAQIAKDQAEVQAEQMMLRDKYLRGRAKHQLEREK